MDAAPFNLCSSYTSLSPSLAVGKGSATPPHASYTANLPDMHKLLTHSSLGFLHSEQAMPLRYGLIPGTCLYNNTNVAKFMNHCSS